MAKSKKKKVEKKKAIKKLATPKKAERKDGLMVVQSAADPKINIVMASELMDDRMIEQSLMGEVVPFYIYRFVQDGKEVVGMSAKGVNEVVRLINKNPKSGQRIRIDPSSMKIEQNVDVDGVKGVQVSVMAQDLVSGGTSFGIKFEAYKKKKSAKNGGGTYDNTFATEKAITKAERNAKRKLIAETLALKMIEKIMHDRPETVRTITPNEVRELPSPSRGAIDESSVMANSREMISRCNEIKTLRYMMKRAEENKTLSAKNRNTLVTLIDEKITNIKISNGQI